MNLIVFLVNKSSLKKKIIYQRFENTLD